MSNHDNAAAWLADDLKDSREWMIHLSQEQIADIDAAARACSEIDIAAITKDNFPLPSFQNLVDDVLDRLEYGRGLAYCAAFLR